MADNIKTSEISATPERSPRSWIAHSRHHTDRIHQLNVKLSGEANELLREMAATENLRLYEIVEKALTFYHRHHHRGGTG